jgi:hypothetical protein
MKNRFLNTVSYLLRLRFIGQMNFANGVQNTLLPNFTSS